MKVLQYLGKLSDGHDVVMTDASYTPFVIVTKYNPNERPGQQWSSAWGYYDSIASLGKAIALIEESAERERRELGLLFPFEDEEDFDLIGDLEVLV